MSAVELNDGRAHDFPGSRNRHAEIVAHHDDRLRCGRAAPENAADLRALGPQLLVSEERVAGLHRPNEFVFVRRSGGGKRNGSTFALAVASERTTRLVTASLVPNLRPAAFATTLAAQLRGKQVTTLTTDNGIENRAHQKITKKTGAPVFFTDPYSSWQKGGVENANRMLRRYFPKGTDFATVAQTDVVNALARINNKPRKILGYKSSIEVAKEKGVILERVS